MCSASIAFAQKISPKLSKLKPPAILAKQPGAEKSSPLRVSKLAVEVVVTGNTAETKMTMEFLNETERVLEGQLVFPLLEGMTVSQYALEVNGKMMTQIGQLQIF